MNSYPIHPLRYLLVLVIALTPFLPQLTMATGVMVGMDHTAMNVAGADQLPAEHESPQVMDKALAEMTCDTECTGCNGSGQCSSLAMVSEFTLLIAPLALMSVFTGHQSHRTESRIPEPDPPRTL